MLKNILKLEGTQELEKSKQSIIKGGVLKPASKACVDICINAVADTPCQIHPDCPILDGRCDGNGGFYYL